MTTAAIDPIYSSEQQLRYLAWENPNRLIMSNLPSPYRPGQELAVYSDKPPTYLGNYFRGLYGEVCSYQGKLFQVDVQRNGTLVHCKNYSTLSEAVTVLKGYINRKELK